METVGVIVLLGVWFFLMLFATLGGNERIDLTYKGELMKQLFATVERILYRWHVPLR
jgi:hypothetical protein